MSLKQIKEGVGNHLFPLEENKELIKKVSDARLEICLMCEEHSSNKKEYTTLRFDDHCTVCSCTLITKTKCLSCECPLKKWKAINLDNYDNTKNRIR